MTDPELLRSVAHDLFAAHAAPEAISRAEAAGEVWLPALWGALEVAGFHRLGVPEGAGGAGGGWAELAVLLRAAGRFAAPVPLAETGPLGGWLLAAADLPLGSGPLTVAPVRPGERVIAQRGAGGWELSGRATRVPWARRATRIAVVVELAGEGRRGVVAVDPAAPGVRIKPGANLAGEARDVVEVHGLHLPADAVGLLPMEIDEGTVLRRGALARAALIAGALERVLDLSVDYARLRQQFGRPIGAFQAIQQELARMAGEVAAAGAAVDASVEAVEHAGEAAALAEIAAARVRAGEAAGRVARTAHQVHGAIGFTDEHQLRHFTRRLWSWRDEFGSERYWAETLGRLAAEAGPDGLWPLITRGPG